MHILTLALYLLLVCWLLQVLLFAYCYFAYRKAR